MSDLSALHFLNTFAGALPSDASEVNVPRQVRNASYTRVMPTPVRAPRLLAWSEALAEELGIEKPAAGSSALEILAGNRVLPGMQPYAARYGGHQFGVWAGQLGDGRAITLGEFVARDGRRQ
ncbi:MAG TPA: protein adenylyltransferase SelO family protein, partial [Burkholderiales bacterium]|nr:protein adenylyltransferase SelO family protein [Burkholderiales bacterium]